MKFSGFSIEKSVLDMMLATVFEILLVFGYGFSEGYGAFVQDEHLEECQCLEAIEEPFLEIWVSSLEECWQTCSKTPHCFSIRYCVSDLLILLQTSVKVFLLFSIQ